MKTATVQNNMQSEEQEYTNDSFSVYFVRTELQVCRIKILGEINTQTFSKITTISRNILENIQSAHKEETIYYMVDCNHIRNISFRSMQQIYNHNFPDNLIIILYSVPKRIQQIINLLSVKNESSGQFKIKADEKSARAFLYQKTGKAFSHPITVTHLPKRSGFSLAQKAFNKIWEHDQKYFTTSSHKLRIVKDKQWQYQPKDQHCSIEMSVLEGNIILIIFEGFIKPLDIDHSYDILNQIIQLFGFNQHNKIYSINDLRAVQGSTLKARKKTTLYEKTFQKYSNAMVTVPSPITRLFIRMLKQFNPGHYRLWHMQESIEQAFNVVLACREKNINVADYVKKNRFFTISRIWTPRNSY